MREKVLFPENPVFDLPIDANVDAMIQREQVLLKNILSEFNKMFDIRNICEKCEKEDNCAQSRDNLGECEGFKEAC